MTGRTWQSAVPPEERNPVVHDRLRGEGRFGVSSPDTVVATVTDRSPPVRHPKLLVVSTVLAGMIGASGCGGGATEPAHPPPNPLRPTTVTVTPGTAQLTALGATVQLAAQVLDQNGQAMRGTPVSWTSTDASVATVDASGLVTAAGNGTATMTATAGRVTGTATVTVVQVVSSVEMDPPSLAPAEAGKQGRDTIYVTVTDAAGMPVGDASYQWTTDNNSGWVFPAEGKTSARGLISAIWVAGWPGNGLLHLNVENSVSNLTTEIATRSRTSANPPSGALYLHTFHEGTAAGYSIDITPLTEPPGTFYAAIQWDGGYAGLQRAGSRYDRQLQFSVWDAPGSGDAQVVEQGEGVVCRPFGGEGTGRACELEYRWRVGSTYRFEVTEEEMTGGSAITLHVTDIDSDERRFVGTLRFARRARMRSFHMFVEDFWTRAEHCLAREVRSAAVRRTRALIDGEWQPMTAGFLGKASTDSNNPGTPGCANVAGRSHPAGVEIVIGGDAVSDPNGPIRVRVPN